MRVGHCLHETQLRAWADRRSTGQSCEAEVKLRLPMSREIKQILLEQAIVAISQHQRTRTVGLGRDRWC